MQIISSIRRNIVIETVLLALLLAIIIITLSLLIQVNRIYGTPTTITTYTPIENIHVQVSNDTTIYYKSTMWMLTTYTTITHEHSLTSIAIVFIIGIIGSIFFYSRRKID